MRTEGTFDPDLFFDYQAMTQEDNFMPYIRDDENHGVSGEGSYFERSPNFSMMIRSNADDEEQLLEQISKIPRFETDFIPIIVNQHDPKESKSENFSLDIIKSKNLLPHSFRYA